MNRYCGYIILACFFILVVNAAIEYGDIVGEKQANYTFAKNQSDICLAEYKKGVYLVAHNCYAFALSRVYKKDDINFNKFLLGIELSEKKEFEKAKTAFQQVLNDSNEDDLLHSVTKAPLRSLEKALDEKNKGNEIKISRYKRYTDFPSNFSDEIAKEKVTDNGDYFKDTDFPSIWRHPDELKVYIVEQDEKYDILQKAFII